VYKLIPKILVQTSIRKPDAYVLAKFNLYLTPEWQYLHFNDEEIFQFFADHPDEEFPLIAEKFSAMPTGAHKADLFRYYFLYIKGGVYVDSDAMIQANIDHLLLENDFFSVTSSFVRDSIFQGFIGCVPKSPIIYESLRDAYNTSPADLANNYFLLTQNMHQIISDLKEGQKVTLLHESGYDNETTKVSDDLGNILLLHFYGRKTVVDIGAHLPGDGADYEILFQAAASIVGVEGAICEIGSRRGGSVKQIIDGLLSSRNLNRNLICIDPYGNIEYAATENEVRRFDYTNQMRDEFLPNLYKYAHGKPVNVIYFCMEDTEFYKRFSDGVPFYNESKVIEDKYSLVLFDGQHCLQSLIAGLDFFIPRMSSGAHIVFDGIQNYPHEKIEQRLIDSGFSLVTYGLNNKKASYRRDHSSARIFSEIYAENYWGSGGEDFPYFSGSGSHNPIIVEAYVNAVSEFLLGFKKKPSVIDLGCGDFSVGAKIRDMCGKYIACDIVKNLIDYNKIKYKELKVDFRVLDFTIDKLPKADIVFIRQVMQHLSNRQILDSLSQITNNFKYLVLTEHLPGNKEFIKNIDKFPGKNIRLDNGSGVDLTAPPFNIQVLSEKVLCSVPEFGGFITTVLYQLH